MTYIQSKNIQKCTGFKLCFYRCFTYLSPRAKLYVDKTAHRLYQNCETITAEVFCRTYIKHQYMYLNTENKFPRAFEP